MSGLRCLGAIERRPCTRGRRRLEFSHGLLEYGAVALILLDQAQHQDDDLKRVLDWLDREGLGAREPTEFVPAMDLYETAAAVEIVADLPGVAADALRIVYTRGVVVIAGRKRPPTCEHHDAAFRQAERSFGRFARVFRLAGALDAGRARATLRAGELHLTSPRIEERRGSEIRIPIATD